MSYIFVHLMGGLGNQLFQYAAGFLHQKINNGKLLFTSPKENPHDVTDYRTIFELEKHDADVPYFRHTLCQEDGFAHWNPSDYKYQVLYLHGYFQNYSTLKPILPEFKNILLDKLKSRREIVLHKYTILPSSGFIHVRRGDYVQWSDTHHLQDMTYYSEGLKKMADVQHWYIFSDDIDWVKQQPLFQNLGPVYVEESDPLMSLALMSEIHDGAIIANSTFSWWGAYLSGSDSVIYPRKWFKNKTPDLFPANWIGI